MPSCGFMPRRSDGSSSRSNIDLATSRGSGKAVLVGASQGIPAVAVAGSNGESSRRQRSGIPAPDVLLEFGACAGTGAISPLACDVAPSWVLKPCVPRSSISPIASNGCNSACTHLCTLHQDDEPLTQSSPTAVAGEGSNGALATRMTTSTADTS